MGGVTKVFSGTKGPGKFVTTGLLENMCGFKAETNLREIKSKDNHNFSKVYGYLKENIFILAEN